jgi:hypothetical protein
MYIKFFAATATKWPALKMMLKQYHISGQMLDWQKRIRGVHNELKSCYEYREANMDCRYFGRECLCKIWTDSHSGRRMYEKAYNYRNLADLSPKTVYYGENKKYQCVKDERKILGIAMYYMDRNDSMYFYDCDKHIEVSCIPDNY